MNNEELFAKIEKLLKTEREYTKTLVGGFEKRLSEKIDTADMNVKVVNKRVDGLERTVEKDLKGLTGKIDQLIEENAHFFQEAGVFFDKTQVKKFIGFPTVPKN